MFKNRPAAAAGNDADALMRRFDLESNTRVWEGPAKTAVDLLCAAFSLFAVWCALFAVMLDEVRLTSFVGCMVIIGYLTYPANRHHVRVNAMPWYDILLMLLCGGSFFYFCFNANAIVTRLPALRPYQVVIGLIGILTVFELCRRCTGVPIMVVAGAFIAYAFWYYGIKKGQGAAALTTLVCRLFYIKTGILSTPVNACSNFIAIFIIFGAFLERSGISDFFIKLANRVAGAASGGPAKVAVISSALCGMVSGSSVGNTVTTGSVTIPMMKKTGYRGEFAGAVEAAASTGGQIMPPIMGAAAFLMVDFLGMQYREIVVRAILPALLYFTGIFLAVHLEAKKLRLTGIPREELPQLGGLLKKVYLLLPLVVLVWLVSSNTVSMAKAAALAILVTIAVSLFDAEHRMGPKKLFDSLAAGARGCVSVAVACCMAGMVAGCLTMTGLANQIFAAILAVSSSTRFIALLLTMLCCIVLGMGVPTTANYCIMATTCAPVLIKMGIPAVAAHFFVFYFGIVADITPPVALAAYAGSAIAKSDPMKTAFNATKLAIAAFIVPYIMAYNPAMVLVDTTLPEVLTIIVTSVMGMFGVAAALNGHLFRPVAVPLRLALGAGGLLMMVPGLATDLVGVALLGSAFAYQYFTAKRGTSAPA